MLFTSISFLCFFLPAVLIAYFLTPVRYKNVTLLLASLFFYLWGEKLLVFLLLATIIFNYGCALAISKGYRKTGIWLSIFASLGSLVYFKYTSFAFTNIVSFFNWLHIDSSYIIIPQIVLPLGISFYTFQVLSYTIDVYRGNTQVCKNLIDFSTYVLLFPHLIAGPIVRYTDIEKQLRQKDISAQRITEGIERFIIGLAKKMFLANNCAIIADSIFDLNTDFYSPGAAWIAAIAYSLQIYFDFSAYSDMAIGLARIFGIDFHENFKYPYTAESIKDFWRKWHISLSSWFRDYLYIPLGGNRVSVQRTYLNLFIVFFATGLWHGASWNFIFWGLWHGLFSVIEKLGFDKVLNKMVKPLRHVYTLFVILIGWVFFRAESFSSACNFLKRMFYINTSNTDIVYYATSFISFKNILFGFLAMLFCLPIYASMKQKVELYSNRYGGAVLYFYYIVIVLLFLSVMPLISLGTYNPFIYFRF